MAPRPLAPPVTATTTIMGVAVGILPIRLARSLYWSSTAPLARAALFLLCCPVPNLGYMRTDTSQNTLARDACRQAGGIAVRSPADLSETWVELLRRADRAYRIFSR